MAMATPRPAAGADVSAHQLPVSQFDRLEVIGRGSIGETLRVQDKSNNSIFAMKLLKEARAPPDAFSSILERLVAVSHPAIASPIGYTLPNPVGGVPLAIYVPFATGGSLAAQIASKAKLSNLEIMKLLFGIAEGLRHLASLGLSHGTLVPTNILLDDQREPRLCDFGMDAFRPAQIVGKSDVFLYGSIVSSLLHLNSLNHQRASALGHQSFLKLMEECSHEKALVNETLNSIVTRFLKRDLWLNMSDGERVAFRQYQRKTLASSFTVQALFIALADIKKTRAMNDQLVEHIGNLRDKFTALTRSDTGQSACPQISEPPTTPEPVEHAVRLEVPTSGRLLDMDISTFNSAPVLSPPPLEAAEHLPISRVILEPQIRPAQTIGLVPHLDLVGRQPAPAVPSVAHPDYPICARLAAKHGGNIVELGLLRITGKSCDPGREKLLPNLVNSQWGKCWISANEPNAWVQFEFLKHTIYLTHYSIRTYGSERGFSHMKSWVVQGSISGRWINLDTRDDTTELNGRSKIGLFSLANPAEVQTIKITQTKPNHAGDDFMIVTNIEFYGALLEDE
jgi:hypothetical protein